MSAGWGTETFVREGATASVPPSDPVLARLAGRYCSDNAWWGVANIVERGGRLWLGGSTPMIPIGDGMWRVGKDIWSPERIVFANPVACRPRTMIFSDAVPEGATSRHVPSRPDGAILTKRAMPAIDMISATTSTGRRRRNLMRSGRAQRHQ